MPVIYDLAGRRFGRLNVAFVGKPNGNRRRWDCVCDCGKTTTVVTADLVSGKTKSCGCYQSDITKERSTTHGSSSRGGKSKGYIVWTNLRSRCNNPAHRQYPGYGGRGIAVCERWNDFANFLADMGEPPRGRTLDRTDNSKGYSLDNCAWRTPSEQNRNRRDNSNLTARGRTMTLTEWERESGVSRQTISRRLAKGWSHEDAIFRAA